MLGKTAGGIQFVVMIAVIDSPYRGRLDQGAQRIGAMARRQIDSSHIVRYVMTQAALVSSYRLVLIEATCFYPAYCLA